MKETSSTIDAGIITALKAVVGDTGWKSDADDLEPHLTEWRGLYTGSSPLLLAPANAVEAAEIIRLCAEHSLAIVPQGGNSGLTGGAIPGLDSERPEILLSASRMRQVRAIDTDNFTITVEAGMVLADVQSIAAEHDLYFPLSLAAEGSCQIGGNISTNAGGTNVLRYGNTRDLVLGLEVVLADGSLYEGLRGLRKDNTGYDLKQLFIGAEGTLGFITAATLKLFPQPQSVATAWLAVSDPADAVQLYGESRRLMGDEMVAFELMGQLAIDMVVEHIPGCRNPLDAGPVWHVLAEYSSARAQVDLDEQLTAFLGNCLDSQLVSDGVLATSESQREAFWRVRHGISEAQKKAGASIKHDVAVPVSTMPEFLLAADKLIAAALPGVRPVSFGHLGDGNLHYNLSPPVDMAAEVFLSHGPALNTLIHTLANDMGGSFSAEHGIGYLKVGELARLKSPVAMTLMRQVKGALDPQGIMNPGKVLNSAG